MAAPSEQCATASENAVKAEANGDYDGRSMALGG